MSPVRQASPLRHTQGTGGEAGRLPSKKRVSIMETNLDEMKASNKANMAIARSMSKATGSLMDKNRPKMRGGMAKSRLATTSPRTTRSKTGDLPPAIDIYDGSSPLLRLQASRKKKGGRGRPKKVDKPADKPTDTTASTTGKKTAAPKKKAAPKKTAPKKTAPKKTAPKKKATKPAAKKTQGGGVSKSKVAPKSVAAKKAAGPKAAKKTAAAKVISLSSSSGASTHSNRPGTPIHKPSSAPGTNIKSEPKSSSSSSKAGSKNVKAEKKSSKSAGSIRDVKSNEGSKKSSASGTRSLP